MAVLTVIAAAQVNTITVTEAQSAGKSVDPDTMGRFHQSLLGALEHEWNIAGIIFPLLVFFFKLIDHIPIIGGIILS